jgi:hypothetical protein
MATNSTLSRRTLSPSKLFTSEAQSSNKSPEFTCFPLLPYELRYKIWKDLCFIPRVIDIWSRPLLEMDAACHLMFYQSHKRVPPAILHTCKEARDAGLKFYTLDFGTSGEWKINQATFVMTAPPQIYINWACDIICPMPLRVENDWANVKFYQSMITDLATKRRKMRRIAITSVNSEVNWIWNILENVWLEEVILFASPGWFEGSRFNNTEIISLDFEELQEKNMLEDLVGVVSDPGKTKTSLKYARRELMTAISYRQLGDGTNLDAGVDMSKSPDINFMKLKVTVDDSQRLVGN